MNASITYPQNGNVDSAKDLALPSCHDRKIGKLFEQRGFINRSLKSL